MNNSFSKVAVWMVIGLVLFTVFKQFDSRAPVQDTVSYTQFMDDAKSGKVRRVDVQNDVLHVTPDSGRPYTLTSPGDLWMVSDLLKAGVSVSGKPREEPSLLMNIFVSWFPTLPVAMKQKMTSKKSLIFYAIPPSFKNSAVGSRVVC